MFIEENFPDVFDTNDKLNTALIVKNILGEKMKENGKYTISKLKEDINSITDNIWGDNNLYFRYQNPVSNNVFNKLAVEKLIKKDDFVSGENINLGGLPSGIYKIEANLTNGQADTLTEYFVVTDFAKKKLPQSQYVHHRLNKNDFAVGEIVKVEFGSAVENQQVYYVLSRGSKVIKQGWLKLAKTGRIEYGIADGDKGGLQFQYIYIYNNRTYSQSVEITVPWIEKDLIITYENFRDKLIPGEQSDFKIKISGKNKDKVQAELLAAMYDASLDQIQPHVWNRILFQNNYGYLPLQGFHFGHAFGTELNYGWSNNSEGGDVIYPILPELIGFQNQAFFNSNYGNPTRMMKRGSQNEAKEEMASDAAAPTATTAPPPVAQSANFEGAKVGDVDASGGNSTQPASIPILSPRTNLRETVFFYPHLKTDKEGNTIISFKMNEAITKWKLMTFAHTKELATSYDEKFIQTKKDLMIVANSPRFFRENDEILFTARVTNLSDNEITANAKLDLTDGLKDTPINNLIASDIIIPVSLKKGESKSVNWKIKIPVGSIDLLKYTVSAVSGNFTDGESSTIPVLSNRILITESMAMYIKGNEKKTYEFKSLKDAPKSQKPYKYTIEISSHPVWYAIQAIPYIIEQEVQSATQLASRFYVNSLSKHIVNQNPQIQEVFTQWQNKDKDALKSNLQKNEDLKNAMLEETPWVVEALTEAKQKGNIARIFDTNTVNADLAQTLTALQALQLPDGSFTWFPGARSDYYSTKYIVEMLGKSIKLDNTGQAVNIANSALLYLDMELTRMHSQLKEDYAKNKLKLEDYQPSEDIIHHLQVRSMFANPSRQNASNEAYNYYQKQALKYWTKYDIFTQSLLGMVDYRSNGSTYKEITKSIMQKSFKSDELGTYWNAGNGYRWYELPIERHASIMEFLHEINYNIASLDEMKIWLLKNKQSNHWSTGKSTAAAISALLLQRGQNQVNLDTDQAVTSIVGEVNLPNEADLQAGTTYYKRAWNGGEIDVAKATIKLNNPNANVAWGGAYYQYFEDVNNIAATNASPLKIEKQLYKEMNGPKGKSLTLLDASNKLNPGDILVSRLIITSDRDMDYIHLKDLRASGLEPFGNISGYRWSGGFGFYESIRDLATHFYIDHLPKGINVFESRQKVVHKGIYSGGLATIQSFYAPEFGGKTEGNKLIVE
jgi:hypothetical protein